MAGQGQQRRVEADGVAHAFDHGALEVVVQQYPRHAAEGDEGQGVAAQEAVHAGVQEEAQEDHAAVTEHHHEAHERSPSAADLQVAEVAPVDLRLLSRQRAQAQVGLGRRSRAHGRHQQPEVRGPAHVAALGHHRVQPRCGERGELLQGGQDEGPVRIDAAHPQR